MPVSPLVDADIFNSIFQKQMKMASYTAALSGEITIAKEYPPVLLLDPAGSDRDVLLPAEADSKGLMFWIFNTADNPAEILSIKEDSDTTVIVALDENEFGYVYCDGTNWRGFSSFMSDITATVAEINILDGATLSTAELNILDGVEATFLELNRVADVSARMIAGGGTLALTEALHDGKTVLFDTASGSVLTLPAATGTGMKIRCLVSVTATTNSHDIVCAGSDKLRGTFQQTQTSDDSVVQYEAAAGDNFVKLTFNRTTTGLAIIGDWVELQDVASAIWAVTGAGIASGSVATPFST